MILERGRVVWGTIGRHFKRRQWPIVLGALTGLLVVRLPQYAVTAMLFWPLIYALVMGWLCRRLLPWRAETPERMPWKRLLLVGVVAGLPLLILFGLFAVVGSVEGKGLVFLFFFFLFFLSLGAALVGPEWLPVLPMLASLPLAAVSLLCMFAVGFAPAFVAVAGHDVRRALAGSLRAWCMNPLSAGMTVLGALILLSGLYLVFGLLLRVNLLVALMGTVAYSIVCTIAGASASVAASAAALTKVEGAAPDPTARLQGA